MLNMSDLALNITTYLTPFGWDDKALRGGEEDEEEGEDQYVPYADRPETYIVPILFLLILVVGVAGNGVLVLTLLRHANLRNIPNTYVLSLALGDLLVKFSNLHCLSV